MNKRFLAAVGLIAGLVVMGCNQGLEQVNTQHSVGVFQTSDNKILVKAVPNAPVSRVVLSELVGTTPTVLWDAQSTNPASDTNGGAFITLGTLPSGWAATVNTFTAFEQDTTYSIALTVEDTEAATSSTVSVSWVYSQATMDPEEPMMPQWTRYGAYGYELSPNVWPFTEATLALYGSRAIAFYGCQTREATQRQGICSHDDLSGQYDGVYGSTLLTSILQPTPDTSTGQKFGLVSVTPSGFPYAGATAVSEPLHRNDGSGGLAIAQMMYDPNAGSAAPVRVFILESNAPQVRYRYTVPPAAFMEYSTDWASEWAIVGPATGAFSFMTGGQTIYLNSKPTLLSGTIAGISNQNAAKPYIVSSVGNSSAVNVAYFKNDNTWTSLSSVNTALGAVNVNHFEIALSSGGDLYGCAIANKSAAPLFYEAKVLRYNGDSWQVISTADAHHSSMAGGSPRCRLDSNGSTVVVSYVKPGGNVYVGRVSGGIVTPWSVALPTSLYARKTLATKLTSDGTYSILVSTGPAVDASGETPNSGESIALYTSTGAEWTVALNTTLPISGFEMPNHSALGFTLHDDHRTVSAFMYSYESYDGTVNNRNVYGGIWRIVAPE